MTSLGVGRLFFLAPATPAGLYAGARVALTFRSQSEVQGAATADVSATDFSIAPVLGAE